MTKKSFQGTGTAMITPFKTDGLIDEKALRRFVDFQIDGGVDMLTLDRKARAGVVRDLATLVKDFPGDSRVNLLLEMSDGPHQLVLGPKYKVKPVPDFFAEAKALLGEAAVL